ncbi:hypothetical protein BJ994_000051 [Arthrobacter pigmenti]|uniref:Uncharacterized protein n=1 Tax=Arthrobacter pigmenti TaxID=271432 RepID=A0A846RMC0_9MICC|nr:hypothetical protein [Arthrobacter pigmenti]NJC20975.1 hypothetical protein [Arthrobacter pigmenti]
MTSAVSSVSLRTSYSLPRIAFLSLAAIAAWIASVTIGSVVRVEPPVEQVALTFHTLSVVAAFGAVLLVDWVGFLWLITRRQLHETSRIESAALPIIWAGIGGLLITGALINPDMQNPFTVVKTAAVLILTLNGILLIPCMRRLNSKPRHTRFVDLDVGMRTHLLICLGISQACWWTAMIVGFVNGAQGG